MSGNEPAYWARAGYRNARFVGGPVEPRIYISRALLIVLVREIVEAVSTEYPVGAARVRRPRFLRL